VHPMLVLRNRPKGTSRRFLGASKTRYKTKQNNIAERALDSIATWFRSELCESGLGNKIIVRFTNQTHTNDGTGLNKTNFSFKYPTCIKTSMRGDNYL